MANIGMAGCNRVAKVPDGTVSQHIQLSTDGGETWGKGWVGIYHRDGPGEN